ncbi:glycyl-radical enzyme activating protein [Anaeromicropila populeti]|uniref:Pyruvate formate lyase activating enzyme n=1 Tax=Anaeromicropila populeti TaxID=37658 RepID=A0A1I6KH30_9FIRM|nr:glycyl-radical enzyme activating protein [Anaeromicropila populeti]SFR90474.1 pyruvate formate lyase activating enzyme [Anaeromicropila populeti]
MKYFEIGWLSTSDGPGSRVVIFLQGCSQRCPWCHSPHSWAESSPLLFNSSRCQNCGMCVDACNQKVHSIQNGSHFLNRDRCINCGMCVAACPNSQNDYLGSALCLPTRTKTAYALFQYVLPQLDIIKQSGGITLSGGEALLQAEEVAEFLKLCKEKNISTCIESSFSLPASRYELVMPYVDYWLAGLRDISLGKNSDEEDKNIINKINLVSKYAKKIIARYPVIDGFTTTAKHKERYLNVMKACHIEEIEFMKCNENMMHYYTLSGIPCEMNLDRIILENNQIEEIAAFFQKEGIVVRII